MSIQAVCSSSSTSIIQQLAAAAKAAQASGTDTTSITGTSSSTESSTDISQLGQLFAKLGDLAKSDPAKFKELTANISDQLKTAASQATGQQQQFLQGLSDEFSKASQSGDPAAIQPPQQAQQHHHHHHGGGGGMKAAYDAASQTDALGITDPTSTSLISASATANTQTPNIFNQIFQQVANA